MIQAGTRFAPSILSQMAKRQEAGADDIWPVPDLFNIADMCCDRWADAQPDRVALIDVRDDAPQNTGPMLNFFARPQSWLITSNRITLSKETESPYFCRKAQRY